MEDTGPCQELNASSPTPLDAAQMGNVLSTIEGMGTTERLMFMTSMIRFAMEMILQISVAMTTDSPGEDIHLDEDNLMLMQTASILRDKARKTFFSLHKTWTI